MEIFRIDVRHSRKTPKFCNFLPLEATVLTLAKNDQTVSTGFLTIFRTPLAACFCDAQEPNKTGGGVKPPSARCVTIGAPVRRGLLYVHPFGNSSATAGRRIQCQPPPQPARAGGRDREAPSPARRRGRKGGTVAGAAEGGGTIAGGLNFWYTIGIIHFWEDIQILVVLRATILTRAPLGYFYNAPHWEGAITSALWSPKLLDRLKKFKRHLKALEKNI